MPVTFCHPPEVLCCCSPEFTLSYANYFNISAFFLLLSLTLKIFVPHFCLVHFESHLTEMHSGLYRRVFNSCCSLSRLLHVFCGMCPKLIMGSVFASAVKVHHEMILPLAARGKWQTAITAVAAFCCVFLFSKYILSQFFLHWTFLCWCDAAERWMSELFPTLHL